MKSFRRNLEEVFMNVIKKIELWQLWRLHISSEGHEHRRSKCVPIRFLSCDRLNRIFRNICPGLRSANQYLGRLTIDVTTRGSISISCMVNGLHAEFFGIFQIPVPAPSGFFSSTLYLSKLLFIKSSSSAPKQFELGST